MHDRARRVMRNRMRFHARCTTTDNALSSHPPMMRGIAALIDQPVGGFGAWLSIVFFASVASGKLPAQVWDGASNAFCSTMM